MVAARLRRKAAFAAEAGSAIGGDPVAELGTASNKAPAGTGGVIPLVMPLSIDQESHVRMSSFQSRRMGRRALRDSDIIHFIGTIIGKNRAIDERSFHIWNKNGKAEDEGGADSRLAAGKHRAPVSSGSGPDKGQTQAGPAGIAGGVRGHAGEGFENVLELIGGNASPLVFHPY